MSEFVRVLRARHVIRCVVCAVEVESPVYTYTDNQFTVQDQHETQRLAEGWRLFVSRSRRWYCPLHEPRDGHKMREITQ